MFYSVRNISGWLLLANTKTANKHKRSHNPFFGLWFRLCLRCGLLVFEPESRSKRKLCSLANKHKHPGRHSTGAKRSFQPCELELCRLVMTTSPHKKDQLVVYDPRTRKLKSRAPPERLLLFVCHSSFFRFSLFVSPFLLSSLL
jgi:hypothetical protein